MAETGTTDQLAAKLERLAQFFDLDALANAGTSPVDIDRYYRANRFAYTLLHSRANVLHMGVSRDGTFKEADFFEQSSHVGRLIGDRGVSCLELAAGRAANSAWLARRYPGSRFVALDRSKVQLGYAQRAARDLVNLAPEAGDYHDLANHADASIGIVFVVEALCYSPDKARVFAEVFRVLKPGGHFLIYDGYAGRPIAERTPCETRAACLLERGMAVDAFEPYEAIRQIGLDTGFTVHSEEDISDTILPTCDRLARRAGRFMDQGVWARLAIGLLPKLFVHNAVTGYLFPDLMRRTVFTYWSTVFEKPETGQSKVL